MAKGSAVFERSAMARQTAEPVVPQTLHQRIQSVMSSHEGLTDARAKLRDLENRRASMSAELDQLSAQTAAPDLEVLAGKILNDEPLTDHVQVFNRRDIVRQQVQAFDLAIAKQRIVVSKELTAASRVVCAEFAGEHKDIVLRILAAEESLKAAVADLYGFQIAMAQGEVAGNNALAYFGLTQMQQIVAQLSHIRTSHWNGWLQQHG